MDEEGGFRGRDFWNWFVIRVLGNGAEKRLFLAGNRWVGRPMGCFWGRLLIFLTFFNILSAVATVHLSVAPANDVNACYKSIFGPKKVTN